MPLSILPGSEAEMRFIVSLAPYLIAGLAAVFHAPAAQGAELEKSAMTEAEAPMWWLGFQLHGITDGRAPDLEPDSQDAYDSNRGTRFGWGGGFTIPLGLNFYHGLGMRTAFSVSYSGEPFDQALSEISYIDDSSEIPERRYRTLEAYFAGGSLLIDVQYIFPLLFGTVKPYLGCGPAIILNYVFTDLTEDEFVLLNNEYNDPNDSNNIDPYSVNTAVGFNGYLGLNFKVTGAMHLNFELEYDVAQMNEAPLLKATDGKDARRAAYLYSVFRFSSGLLFNF